ncbi:MAG: filamentation induced by cAMP protein Fic [Elusimicrobia bacterium]|nr:MAG: filamentation induced by cAMP protein Fic [Elusimicrobiota bacterium]
MTFPRVHISPELLRLLTEATELKVWISQAVVDVSWLPALQKDTAARLAHSSTAIEGNPLALPEVQALCRGESTGAPEKAAQEIRNYLGAMRWIWNRKAGAAITEGDLLRLHALLTAKTLPPAQVGRYKTKPNRVIGPDGRTVYSPPGPEQARPLTRQLIAWINGPESARLHPVIVNAVAHHRLVSIHPFADGNGRAARALGVWLLCARGFDTEHLFALDEFYEAERQRYYDKIQQARDLDGNLTYWLEYAAEAVLETLKKTRGRIESLKVSAVAPRMRLTKRQEDVLRLLRDRGRAKAPDLEAAFGLTRARIAQVVKPLVDAGLVVREGRTRATTYRLA